MSLNFIKIDTQLEPNCAVIWLHGLGASGHDFEPIVSELNLPGNLRARFIFPQAPIRAVTLNNGIRMPAWYDIHGLEMDCKEDVTSIQRITAVLHDFIGEQIKGGIVANKIVLAGFSQGGALALYAGLTYSQRLAGLLGLSCYLPLREQIENRIKNISSDLPIFMAHGLYDDVVPLAFAKLAQEILDSLGFQIEWRDYPCSHTVCPEEIRDIRAFLLRCWN